jgi:hypothetical protein
MTAPVSLVAKPTAEEEVRQSVISVLRMALEEAEAGNVDGVAMILSHPDGTWTHRGSEHMEFSRMVGRFEMLKQKWIAEHFEREDAV